MSISQQSQWRWPDFSHTEMACRHCGAGYDWPLFMDLLQAMRDDIGRPLRVLSGHRCGIHNARVGGAPLSQHLKLAADIALDSHDPVRLRRAAQHAGFTGFGYYRTFLHLDLGRPRQWFSPHPSVRDLWQI
ncbi:D-Ala-D-Ala carboxypeptidase family metallohydrolase [Fretibacter rubidus]|uniref:D-Ala-D-Ala carboxypeptidase family metallohydrolase n=1 Tax=Fretibacter rubidus TaxID=570162 RepID=UPI00352B351D